MADNNKHRKMEENLDLYQAVELMKKRYTTATDEYFAAMRQYGIDLNEEKIIEDYSRVRDIKTLNQMYYDHYGKILDNKQTDEWLNSDVFMELLERIIADRFSVEETGDPYFITLEINKICSGDLRKTDQKEIEKILKAITILSQTRNIRKLDDTIEMFDINGLLKELIRVCHDRNPAFRKLILDLYKCYDDMDPKIFPSVYKELHRGRK